jgi:hypothetical protein
MRRALLLGAVAAKQLVQRCKPGNSVQVRVGDGHWIDAVLVSEDAGAYKVRYENRPTYCTADPSKCSVDAGDIVLSCKCAEHGFPCREWVEAPVTPAPARATQGPGAEEDPPSPKAPGVQTRFSKRIVVYLVVALFLYVACAVTCYSRNSRAQVKPRVEPIQKGKPTLDARAAAAVAKEMPEAWAEEKPPEPPKVVNPPPLSVEERGRALPPLPSSAAFGRPGPADWSGKPGKRVPSLRDDAGAGRSTPWSFLGNPVAQSVRAQR